MSASLFVALCKCNNGRYLDWIEANGVTMWPNRHRAGERRGEIGSWTVQLFVTVDLGETKRRHVIQPTKPTLMEALDEAINQWEVLEP